MNPIHKRLDADFEREFDKVIRDSMRHGRGYMVGNKHVPIEQAEIEAVNGICSDDDVCEADREPPVLVGMFDPIPMPRDPYGCENPVSQSEEE
jgi:hypothetical protein